MKKLRSPISNLSVLISSMEPVLNDGVYVYTSVPHGTDTSQIPTIATMHEAEGITLILSEEQAFMLGLPVMFRCAWITLNVHSDLNAVGLTAAFAKALGSFNKAASIEPSQPHS
jgi:hypothetical protein